MQTACHFERDMSPVFNMKTLLMCNLHIFTTVNLSLNRTTHHSRHICCWLLCQWAMGSAPASAAGSKSEDRNSPNTGTFISSKASSLSGKNTCKQAFFNYYYFTILNSAAVQEPFSAL